MSFPPKFEISPGIKEGLNMPLNERLSTHGKALKMNLDKLVHGTLAEIGAGQETARWFFRVGGAANTVAKTISAYDMAVSDAIYGSAERYVSRERLEAMLDHEYSLLLERLDEKRGANTTFFVFANTVATRSYSRQEEGHGWIGVRFQSGPRSRPSEIIIHVRLLDHESTHEQEALGIIGINLIYAAFYLRDRPEKLMSSLLDELTRKEIEVDMISLAGPCFEGMDPRLMSLQLVVQGLTNAAMFTADGEAVSPGEILYGKDVLISRGEFRPVTNTMMDMLKNGSAQFSQGEPAGDEPVVLMEMSLHNLVGDSGIDPTDFLARAMLLEKLGKMVLITNLAHFYGVAMYLSHFKIKRIGIILGVPALAQVFEEKYYADLDGGILEAFGRLFKFGVKMLVYPSLDSKGGVISVENMNVAPQLRHLYRYLVDNGLIFPIRTYDRSKLGTFPRDVLAMIQEGDERWKELVPAEVARLIADRGYFGYRPGGRPEQPIAQSTDLLRR
jgi:hypothetical protein